MAAVDNISTRWAPLPLYKVIYEQLGSGTVAVGIQPGSPVPNLLEHDDVGPVERAVWVRAKSSEHAAWKAARLVAPYGWELTEVIRVQ